jgi:hypothetical protein
MPFMKTLSQTDAVNHILPSGGVAPPGCRGMMRKERHPCMWRQELNQCISLL